MFGPNTDRAQYCRAQLKGLGQGEGLTALQAQEEQNAIFPDG